VSFNPSLLLHLEPPRRQLPQPQQLPQQQQAVGEVRHIWLPQRLSRSSMLPFGRARNGSGDL
jgi:hypothetical protein